MRIKSSSYFLLFLLVLTAAVIGISLTFDAWESKMLPIVAASFVFILSAIQLYKEIITKEIKNSETDNEQTGTKGASFSSVLGWVLGFPLIIYFLGFFIAIPLFLITYIKLRGRTWASAITIAVITTAMIYGIFEFTLKSDLWKGLIFIHLS